MSASQVGHLLVVHDDESISHDGELIVELVDVKKSGGVELQYQVGDATHCLTVNLGAVVAAVLELRGTE